MFDLAAAPSRNSVLPDWNECARITRTHGRTFYFASLFLPPRRRRSIHSAYAFCRIADDIVDLAPTSGRETAAAALDAWEREIDTPTHPVSVAFQQARQTYGIPDLPVRDLMLGVRSDLDHHLFETWADLYLYSYHVAGTIGLISAPVLGCTDDAALPYAVNLGIAMQLTNIVRDVAEDAAMGRLYLPLEDLVAFGVDPESVLAGHPNGRFKELIAFEVERARGLYNEADIGIRSLIAPGKFTTLASSRLYAAILDAVEKQGCDPFKGRAAVPTSRKLLRVPSIYVDYFRLYLPASSQKTRQATGEVRIQAISTPTRTE